MINNINIGILGHVDSGKTSLSKALSQIASTCAFDKHPQSQQRKITLDLGFSALRMPLNDSTDSPDNSLLVTLVDCPGHASLLKTILSGALIIDQILLIIDITKGIQTQTSECIVIGEIICPERELIVVLNKVDLIEEKKRDEKVKKVKEALLTKVFSKTKFASVKVVCASATQQIGVKDCIDAIMEAFMRHRGDLEQRRAILNAKPLLFPVDHCFQIQGKGTVMTGTVLQGRVAVGDSIFICGANETKKVKSINIFKQGVQNASTGDRCGVLVTDFKSDRMERGYLTDASNSVIQTVNYLVARVEKVRFFTHEVKSRTKFHITLGHATSMGKVFFFSRDTTTIEPQNTFDPNHTFSFEEELPVKIPQNKVFYVMIDLETSLPCYENAILIGSRLDTDFNVHHNVCRIAFHGVVQQIQTSSDGKKANAQFAPPDLHKLLHVYRFKTKLGHIDTNPKLLQKTMTPDSLIGTGLVSKEAMQRYKDKSVKNHPLQAFLNRKVSVKLSDTVQIMGTVSSAFGKSGKYHIQLERRLPDEFLNGDQVALKGGEEVRMDYRVNVLDPQRRWEQA